MFVRFRVAQLCKSLMPCEGADEPLLDALLPSHAGANADLQNAGAGLELPSLVSLVVFHETRNPKAST